MAESRECPHCGEKMHWTETPEHPSLLHKEDCPSHPRNVVREPGDLFLEEKATNHETWKHIEQVMKLLEQAKTKLTERMFSHDRSKLDHPEVTTFTTYTPKLRDTTYGSDEYKRYLAEMKPALDHHYANNRHHPEHFPNGVEDMNLIDILEMFLDWKAACMRHADGDIRVSIEKNTERFGLDPQLVKILSNTVQVFEESVDG